MPLQEDEEEEPQGQRVHILEEEDFQGTFSAMGPAPPANLCPSYLSCVRLWLCHPVNSPNHRVGDLSVAPPLIQPHGRGSSSRGFPWTVHEASQLQLSNSMRVACSQLMLGVFTARKLPKPNTRGFLKAFQRASLSTYQLQPPISVPLSIPPCPSEFHLSPSLTWTPYHSGPCQHTRFTAADEDL